jgi:hypothetical protein
MCSVISMGYRARGARLGVPVWWGVIMPRAMVDVPMILGWPLIDVRVAHRLGMIMLVTGRCWFGEWIADVVWNRLAGTVKSAVPHPAG